MMICHRIALLPFFLFLMIPACSLFPKEENIDEQPLVIEGVVTASTRDDIVIHPRELLFDDLEYRFLDDDDFAFPLEHGHLAYIIEDASLPLVEITLFAGQGLGLEKTFGAGKSLLAKQLLEDGSMASMTPQQFKTRLSYLSTTFSISIEEFHSAIYIDTLSKNMDESLDMLFDLLLRPKIDQKKLSLAKKRTLAQMARGNDDLSTIEYFTWKEVIYGEDHWISRRPTQTQIEQVTPQDIIQFSQAIFHQGPLVFAVTGDVDSQQIAQVLRSKLQQLPSPSKTKSPSFTFRSMSPGVYGVHKKRSPQSRVVIGNATISTEDSDFAALLLFNQLLGAQGAGSRIMQKLQGEENLAYSVNSRLDLNHLKKNVMRINFQSNNDSVRRAIMYALDAIKQLQGEPVPQEELELAKASLLADLHKRIEHQHAMAESFASSHLLGREKTFWKKLFRSVERTSAKAVSDAGRKYFNKENLKILIVGDLEAVQAPVDETPSLETLVGSPLVKLPLKSPLTLQ